MMPAMDALKEGDWMTRGFSGRSEFSPHTQVRPMGYLSVKIWQNGRCTEPPNTAVCIPSIKFLMRKQDSSSHAPKPSTVMHEVTCTSDSIDQPLPLITPSNPSLLRFVLVLEVSSSRTYLPLSRMTLHDTGSTHAGKQLTSMLTYGLPGSCSIYPTAELEWMSGCSRYNGSLRMI